MSDLRKILLYGDVDLKYTDGSGVWLLSMAKALCLTESQTSLLLKSKKGAGGLFADLDAIEGLRIIDDFSDNIVRGPRYQPLMAARRIESLVLDEGFDVVVCRGFALCQQVAKQRHAGMRLWAYMTDIPQSGAEMTPEIVSQLTYIAKSANRVLAQTEESRDFLEYHVPMARGKTLLLPPMIPDTVVDSSQANSSSEIVMTERPLRLVYAGKFARHWKTLEMCQLPRQAAEYGLKVELTMIGDKIQNDPVESDWSSRMRNALESSPGVDWVGGMSRAASLGEIRQHDLGLAWRDSELDNSHELSTKLLEYIACGALPLLNRTVLHERLLGDDYPLFIDHGQILEILVRAGKANLNLGDLRSTALTRLDPYWLQTRARILESELNRAVSFRPHRKERTNILVYGSEAFAESVLVDFGGYCGTTVERYIGGPQPSDSVPLLDVAEISTAPIPAQSCWIYWRDRIETPPPPANLNVAGVVVQRTSDRVAASRWADIPVGRVFVVPPLTDVTARRPKNPRSRFTVGLVVDPEDETWSLAWGHELLKRLVQCDRRYTLRVFLAENVGSKKVYWNRELILDSLSALAADPLVGCSWSLENSSGAARWLRDVGWMVESQRGAVNRRWGATVEESSCVVIGPVRENGAGAGDEPEFRVDTVANEIIDAQNWETQLRTEPVSMVGWSDDSNSSEAIRFFRAATV